MLDNAFEALKSYDWGADRGLLAPIDEAVVSAGGDAAASAELEARLIAALQTDVSRDAKDYICRKLMILGSAASAPALSQLLTNNDLAHMARVALERIPAPEAAQALRDALPKLTGELKAGVIGSLGVRRDAASATALAALLQDADRVVARAAAISLGNIRTAEASKALTAATPNSAEVGLAVVDGRLACAEQLLADGQNGEALSIYKGIAAEDHPKHIRLAATRGILACASQGQ